MDAMKAAIEEKIDVLKQLGIEVNEEEKIFLWESRSEAELDRRARDLIVHPMKRELVIIR